MARDRLGQLPNRQRQTGTYVQHRDGWETYTKRQRQEHISTPQERARAYERQKGPKHAEAKGATQHLSHTPFIIRDGLEPNKRDRAAAEREPGKVKTSTDRQVSRADPDR